MTLTLIAAGKEKKLYGGYRGDPNLVVIENTDNVTAGNGARHAVIPGKGAAVTRATSAAFALLARRGVPVAFEQMLGNTSYLAPFSSMIPVEIVVRLKAAGSYCARNGVPKGQKLDEPVVEYYLKTTGGVFDGMTIGKDDPFMVFSATGEEVWLYDAGEPIREPIHKLQWSPDGCRALYDILMNARPLVLLATDVLHDTFSMLGGELIDIKYEVGRRLSDGKLVIADSIDPSCFRLEVNGEPWSKEIFRAGASEAATLTMYRKVADLMEGFAAI